MISSPHKSLEMCCIPMKLYIFDIDGTLTRTDPELVRASGYTTHAYWDLLTFQFVENKEALKREIDEWRPQVANLGDEAFITSSADMMQRALLQTVSHLSEQDIVNHAKKITHDFITAEVVIKDAIAFLNSKAEEGHLCILSTGSYQSGAVGFLNALSEAELISSTALNHIMVSGAIVDWERKQLIHANIHNNKVTGLNDLLQEKYGFTLDPTNIEHEVYVYADDPYAIDFGILSLTNPEKRYVIAHHKNIMTCNRMEYIRIAWEQLI